MITSMKDWFARFVRNEALSAVVFRKALLKKHGFHQMKLEIRKEGRKRQDE